jgi:hypothetical protein
MEGRYANQALFADRGSTLGAWVTVSVVKQFEARAGVG